MAAEIEINEGSPDTEAMLESQPVEKRENSGNKKYFLSVIGSLDNIFFWNMIYFCSTNGGGTFFILLFIVGIPFFYMRLTLGHHNGKGAINCWGHFFPLFKGIDYAVLLISFYENCSSNVINAINLQNIYEFFRGFDVSTILKILANETLKNTTTTNASSILEIHELDGIQDLGVKWEMVVCLLTVISLGYFASSQKIRSCRKVVWFTALFLYAGMLALLVRVLLLPDSASGIQFYMRIDSDVIYKAELWAEAAIQVLSLLGPKLANAPYKNYKNYVCKDIIIPTFLNLVTAFIYGLIFFSILGYMAHTLGQKIEDFATGGPDLVLEFFNVGIATMPHSTFCLLVFFMMLLTLGFKSAFDRSEAIITALCDLFPKIKRNRVMFVAMLFSLYFVYGLLSCTQGGFYFFQLLDKYVVGYSILLAVLSEAIAVSWIYGKKLFCPDQGDKIDCQPRKHWIYCLCGVALLILLFIIVFGLLNYMQDLSDYNYPWWADVLGLFMSISSMIMIPAVAIYKICVTKGSFMERLKSFTTPVEYQQVDQSIAIQPIRFRIVYVYFFYENDSSFMERFKILTTPVEGPQVNIN